MLLCPIVQECFFHRCTDRTVVPLNAVGHVRLCGAWIWEQPSRPCQCMLPTPIVSVAGPFKGKGCASVILDVCRCGTVGMTVHVVSRCTRRDRTRSKDCTRRDRTHIVLRHSPTTLSYQQELDGETVQTDTSQGEKLGPAARRRAQKKRAAERGKPTAVAEGQAAWPDEEAAEDTHAHAHTEPAREPKRDLHLYICSGDCDGDNALIKLIAYRGEQALGLDPVISPSSSLLVPETIELLEGLVDGDTVSSMTLSLPCQSFSRIRGLMSESGYNAPQLRSKAYPWGLPSVTEPEGDLHSSWFTYLTKHNDIVRAGIKLARRAMAAHDIKVLFEHPPDVGDRNCPSGVYTDKEDHPDSYVGLSYLPEVQDMILEYGMRMAFVTHCAWVPGVRRKLTMLLHTPNACFDVLRETWYQCQCPDVHTVRTGGARGTDGASRSIGAAAFPCGMNWTIALILTGAKPDEVKMRRLPDAAAVGAAFRVASSHLAPAGIHIMPVGRA